MKLAWSAATDDKGVKNYDVLRDGAKVATVTTTSYTDTGLTAGTDYSYTVRARDTADQTGPASGAVAVHTTGGGTTPPTTGDKVKLGYFTEWGIYGRNYNVKNLVTSGSAAKITHINYAFGNVTDGQCAIGDSYADYDKAFTADQSVRRRRRHLGPAAARQLQPAAQAQGQVPEHQGALVLRRLDLVRRLRPGRGQPGRVRAVLLRPGRGPALGRRLRRHRHRLGVPERLRPDLRHQRRRGLQEPDGGAARQVRLRATWSPRPSRPTAPPAARSTPPTTRAPRSTSTGTT